jgi:FKBP-type peptidyl-prolyl cis-trans isomerase (trigger factor)
MISALNKLPDGTVELTITIPWKRVSESYQKTLTELAKKAEIKGFRKGKAPQKIVEERLGKSAIYERVLKTLVTQVYLEAIKEQKVKPIINPQIKVISIAEGKDWQIQATTCELPKVILGDYRGEVKKASAAEKIWVPGKDEKKPKGDQVTQDQHLQKIFAALLKSVKVKIPNILIQEEVNRMLSRLIDQTGRLGLTIEQYLASVSKTNEQLRTEYQTQAEESIRLELILSQIAEKEKIAIKDDEVEKMIKAAPDEETKKAMATATQKAYIKQLLRKRRVIDNLTKL